MKAKTLFYCTECGNETAKWAGKCPACGAWNTIVEQPERPKGAGKGASVRVGITRRRACPVTDLTADEEIRFPTGMGELDRVLGGGAVKGSLVLVGGAPGIGKSTLMLQICSKLCEFSKVLYISGEESEHQLKLRAKRLHVESQQLLVLSETNLGDVLEAVNTEQPDVLIVDSIQTVSTDRYTSAPGSITQVRECALACITKAKNEGLSVILVGHVNKEGGISGPKMLEHMVDAVFCFEGERRQSYRIIRAIKNRFGSTNESGLFTMTSSGLSELENPSQLLLAERAADQAGSAVAAVLDGMRPMLGEIQALTAHSVFAVPRRTASGMDYNRLIILLAVLEKRLGVPLGSQDVYINVVGGLRLTETAADLPVALAVYSSLRDISMDSRTVVMGEVGLTGDIRRVPQALRRVKEAAKMGFNTFILPKGNLEDIETDKFPDCHFVGVATLREAIEKAFRR